MYIPFQSLSTISSFPSLSLLPPSTIFISHLYSVFCMYYMISLSLPNIVSEVSWENQVRRRGEGIENEYESRGRIGAYTVLDHTLYLSHDHSPLISSASQAHTYLRDLIYATYSWFNPHQHTSDVPLKYNIYHPTHDGGTRVSLDLWDALNAWDGECVTEVHICFDI
jgi:hypothetical protein